MVDIDGVVVVEGIDVVGVAHHACVEHGFIRCGGWFSPEGEHQVVGREDGCVDGRQNDGLVVTVRTSIVVVPVETLHAAGGVVVGGADADIGIARIATVVEVAPAGNETGAVAAAA